MIFLAPICSVMRCGGRGHAHAADRINGGCLGDDWDHGFDCSPMDSSGQLLPALLWEIPWSLTLQHRPRISGRGGNAHDGRDADINILHTDNAREA